MEPVEATTHSPPSFLGNTAWDRLDAEAVVFTAVKLVERNRELKSEIPFVVCLCNLKNDLPKLKIVLDLMAMVLSLKLPNELVERRGEDQIVIAPKKK
jgi:hypothetical protein